MASLIPYSRSSREYKLKQQSYQTLVTYIKLTPPRTHLCPHGDLPSQSAVYSPSLSVDLPPASHSSLPTIQRTPPQIPSTLSYSPAISRSASYDASQAPVFPSSYRIPVVPYTNQDPHMYDAPRRNKRLPLLPYTHSPSRPSPSTPEPDSSVLTAFIGSLFFLGFLGAVSYGGYRLLHLVQWTLGKMKGKWGAACEILVGARALQFIRVRFKMSGVNSMFNV